MATDHAPANKAASPETTPAAVDIEPGNIATNRMALANLVLRNTPDIIAVVDHDFRYMVVSSAYARLHGFEADEMIGRATTDIFEPEVFQAIVKPKLEQVLDGASFSFEVWLDFDAVGRRFIAMTYSPLRSSDGSINGILAVGRDMTEQQLAKNARDASNRLFRDLVDNSMQGIMIHAGDRVLYTNSAMAEIFGYTLDEFGQLNLSQLIPKERQEIINSLQKKPKVIGAEAAALAKGGRDIWIQFSSMSIDWNDAPARLTTVIDVTEQRLARRRLWLADRVIESSSDLICVISRDETYRYANKAYAAAFGRTQQEVTGCHAADLWDEDILTGTLRPEMARAIAGKDISYESWFDFSGIGRHYMSINYFPFIDDHGVSDGIVVIARDMTERLRAQQATEASEAKYRDLTDGSLQGVVVHRDSDIIYANRSFADFMSTTVEALIGTSSEAFIVPEDSVRLREYAKLSDVPYFECRCIDAKGDLVWLAGSGRDIMWEGAPARQVTTINITKRKLAEEKAARLTVELNQMSRRNTMGEMTATLAHELNQPLTSIANYCRGSLRRLEQDGRGDAEIHEAITRAAEQAERAGGIIHNISNFIQGRETAKNEVSVNTIVEEVIPVAIHEANRADIRITTRLSPTVPPILVQAVEIQQVVLNLVKNAMEAAATRPDGKGDVRVITGYHKAWKSVFIRIDDNGPGLDEEIVQKIFEPFFSTRADGMGMGLAISRSIIERHGGSLKLRAAKAPGASFEVCLPLPPPTEDSDD